MSSDASDIEMKSALPAKPKKRMPKSPTEEFLIKKKPIKKVVAQDSQDSKKLTTKVMIEQALMDLKSRKGVSLYAIKKYLKEKYDVDTEKINYIIKKYIKKGVEEGTIVQVKGTGASGSFKLVSIKEKKAIKPKNPKVDKGDKEKLKVKDKSDKKKSKSKETSVKSKITKAKSTESNPVAKPAKLKKKIEKETTEADGKVGLNKQKKLKKKIIKGMITPKKKGVMMKRKSIGTIIKPPKMKPSAKA